MKKLKIMLLLAVMLVMANVANAQEGQGEKIGLFGVETPDCSLVRAKKGASTPKAAVYNALPTRAEQDAYLASFNDSFESLSCEGVYLFAEFTPLFTLEGENGIEAQIGIGHKFHFVDLFGSIGYYESARSISEVSLKGGSAFAGIRLHLLDHHRQIKRFESYKTLVSPFVGVALGGHQYKHTPSELERDAWGVKLEGRVQLGVDFIVNAKGTTLSFAAEARFNDYHFEGSQAVGNMPTVGISIALKFRP